MQALTGLSGLSGIVGGFSPANINGLQLWLSADQGTNTDGAAAFTAASSQYLSVANNSSVQTGNIDFTVAAWVYLASKGSPRTIAGRRVDGASNGEFTFVYDNATDRFVFSIFNGATLQSLAANNLGSPALNTWYYIVAWHDTTASTVNIQVNNGTADSATRTITPTTVSTPLTLGAQQGTPAFFMEGRLDSVGFWKRILTGGERTSLYNSGAGFAYADLTSALKTSLVSWWDLDEITGNRNDSQGTNHLTSNNSVGSAQGITAYSAAFTAASSQFLSVADNASLQTGNVDFTLSAWVYLTTKGALRSIIAKRTAFSAGDYSVLYDNSTDRFTFNIFDGASSQGVVANNFGSPALSTWYQVVARQDTTANTISISVNAGTADTATRTLTPASTNGAVKLGAQKTTSADFWDGRIGPVGFWKRVLNQADINELYNGGNGKLSGSLSAGLQTSLISYWNLNEQSGNRADSFGTNTLSQTNNVSYADGIVATLKFVTDGDPIRVWQDQSGNHNDAVQLTASKKPLYKAATINGRGTLRWDGVDDILTTLLKPSGQLTVFVVRQFAAFDTTSRIPLSFHKTGTPDGGLIYGAYDVAGTNQHLLLQTGLGGAWVDGVSQAPSGTALTTNAALDSIVVASGSTTFYVNGAAVITDNTHGAVAVGNNLVIGGNAHTPTINFFNGDIAEVLIYNTALNPTQRQTVEQGLNQKYQIW